MNFSFGVYFRLLVQSYNAWFAWIDRRQLLSSSILKTSISANTDGFYFSRWAEFELIFLSTDHLNVKIIRFKTFVLISVHLGIKKSCSLKEKICWTFMLYTLYATLEKCSKCGQSHSLLNRLDSVAVNLISLSTFAALIMVSMMDTSVKHN